MRGLQAPRGPFFSAARGTASGSDHAAIHAPQLLINLSSVDVGRTQVTQNLIQRAIVIPLVKQVPNCVPRAELFWQITPRRARSENPQDAIHHGAPIAPRSSGPSGSWKKMGDALPLVIRQPMSNHINAFPGRFTLTRPATNVRQSGPFRKDQFSDRA